MQDVTANLETGTITSIIVPGSNKFLSMFASSSDIVIPWQNIKCIGDDIILVEIWKWMPKKRYDEIGKKILKKIEKSIDFCNLFMLS